MEPEGGSVHEKGGTANLPMCFCFPSLPPSPLVMNRVKQSFQSKHKLLVLGACARAPASHMYRRGDPATKIREINLRFPPIHQIRTDSIRLVYETLKIVLPVSIQEDGKPSGDLTRFCRGFNELAQIPNCLFLGFPFSMGESRKNKSLN